jgi:predicted porin
MNKKLMAVAVAGALAAPGLALAQASSVTITGNFKVGWEYLNIDSANSTRTNSSQYRIVDNSSKIIFKVNEDLGNGLQAIGQLDLRFAPDQATSLGATANNPIGSGNTYVGLSSKQWGMLTLGRWDLHYGKGPSENTRGAGALVSSDVSVFDYIGGAPIANTTRTANVVRYDSPVWSGFSGTVAWSANPGNGTGGEADLASPGTVAPGNPPSTPGATTRRGDAWNINPKFVYGPFSAEYSYWKAKPDAPTLTTNDQRGDSINAKYQWGGFQVGLGYNKSKLNNATTGTLFADRDAWEIAAQYKWGPHGVFGHYVDAGSVKSDTVGVLTDQTKARMYALTYEYSLSKRTSLAATYAKIDNDNNINYNFFTTGSLGSADATAVGLGESPSVIQLTINHSF